jgi:hypothetical protein
MNQLTHHRIMRLPEVEKKGSEREMIWLNGGMIITATAASNHSHHLHHSHHHHHLIGH